MTLAHRYNICHLQLHTLHFQIYIAILRLLIDCPWYKKESLLVCSFMHSDIAGTSATKLYMAYSFIQRKVEGYVCIKKKIPDETR